MMNRQFHTKQQANRKLDRSNALKDIDYDATSSPSNRTRSLDLNRSSFRVEGVDGDFDLICRSLGLSGPEDFAIPAAAWEARKSRSVVEKDRVSRNLDKLVVTVESKVWVRDNLVSTSDKVRVIRDNLVDTVEDKVRVSENCVDHVRHCDELGSNQNLENQYNLLEAAETKVMARENERNGNGVRIRGYDEVAIESGDEKLRVFDSSGSNSVETFRPKVTDRESKSIEHGFSRVKKNGFTPDRIEVERRKNQPRDCDEELSTRNSVCRNGISVRSLRSGRGGIKGDRPPVLAPPPVMSPSQKTDDTSSSWDLLRSFGPPSDDDSESCTVSSLLEKKMTIEESEEVDRRSGDVGGEWLGDIGVLSESCSDTSDDKDDDRINLAVEPLHFVSPLGKFEFTINSWQKGDFLGSGSFGTVYEGYTDDGIFFAVKEVSLLDQGDQGKQSIYQLEQEIFFLSQFKHENIVQYFGTDKDKGKLYIFLELVTKGSLASLYQKYNLQDSQVSAYTRQILNGLNYLHLRKVVHRDIKCANILVDANGSVKLADFGLAKATNLNDVKSCKGTAFWMAPEVVNRKNHGYGLAADIWSLGCTVLEMLTRRIPYSHLEGMQALFRIGRGEPPLIPNSISSEARDFISKCLQVNPDDRPTAAQLLDHPFVKRPLTTFSAPASPFHHGRRS